MTQTFNYNLDLTISYKLNNKRYCLTTKDSISLYFEDCELIKTAWIYDNYRKYFIHLESLKCLSRDFDYQIILDTCAIQYHFTERMWQFEYEKKDETFRRVYPDITVEDLKFVQEELQSRPAESITEVEDLFNWGSFIQKTKKKENKTGIPQQTCMTHSTDLRLVSLENCTPQEKEFLKQNQMFEYATDYTIRKFTSNKCLHVSDTRATLENCNENSMRWGFNELTGQFMELHSIGCLGNYNGKIQLGLCNDDQKPRNQKWKFEYHSPMLVNSTDAPRLTPAIILQWHRNFSIHDMPFPPLPKIIERLNTIETIDESNPSPVITPDSNSTITVLTKEFTQPTTTTSSTTTSSTTTTKPPTSTTTATATRNPTTINLITPTNIQNIPMKFDIFPPSQPLTQIRPTTPFSPTTAPQQLISHLQRETAPQPEIDSQHKNQPSEIMPFRIEEDIEEINYFATSTATYPNMTAPTTPVHQKERSVNQYVNDSTWNSTSENKTLPNKPAALNRREISEIMAPILQTFHEQYKQNLEIQHENELAKEIRQVYCQVSVLRRLQAVTLSQTNGILAATVLGLPPCSRLQGLGQSLLLQECERVQVFVTARETKCGFQPLTVYNNKNYTIGTDG